MQADGHFRVLFGTFISILLIALISWRSRLWLQLFAPATRLLPVVISLINRMIQVNLSAVRSIELLLLLLLLLWPFSRSRSISARSLADV